MPYPRGPAGCPGSDVAGSTHTDLRSDTKRRIERHHVVLAAIVGGAFALRLAWSLHADPHPVSDFHDYWSLARGIVEHRQFGYPEPTAFFLPMHPLYLSAFVAISESPEFVRLATVAISSLTVIPMYLAGLGVVGSRRGALVAAAGFAVFPTFVLFSPILATEHLFIFLMVSAIAVATTRPDLLVTAVATGILLGLAQLTRGEAVFYTPAFVLWIAFGLRHLTLRRRAVLGLAMLVAIGVTLVPWYVRNAVVVDPSVGLSTSSGLNFYFAHNDSGNYGDFIEGNPLYGLPNEEASALGWELGLRHIRENPLSLFSDTWTGTTRLFGAPDYAIFWSTQATTGPGANDFAQGYVLGARTLGEAAHAATIGLILLAIGSLAFARSSPPGFVWLIIPLIASTWILRTVIYWAKPRYGYFITVMLVFAAAIAIDRVIDLLRRRSVTAAS